MRWHGYLATLVVLAATAAILSDGKPTLDGRHLLMVAGAVWLVWSLCQPAAPRKH